MKRIWLIIIIAILAILNVYQYLNSKEQIDRKDIDGKFSSTIYKIAEDISTESNTAVLESLVELNTLSKYTSYAVNDGGFIVDYPSILLTEYRNLVNFNKPLSNQTQLIQSLKELSNDPNNKLKSEKVVSLLKENL